MLRFQAPFKPELVHFVKLLFAIVSEVKLKAISIVNVIHYLKVYFKFQTKKINLSKRCS